MNELLEIIRAALAANTILGAGLVAIIALVGLIVLRMIVDLFGLIPRAKKPMKRFSIFLLVLQLAALVVVGYAIYTFIKNPELFKQLIFDLLQ